MGNKVENGKFAILSPMAVLVLNPALYIYILYMNVTIMSKNNSNQVSNKIIVSYSPIQVES